MRKEPPVGRSSWPFPAADMNTVSPCFSRPMRRGAARFAWTSPMSPGCARSPSDEVPLPPAPARGRMARGESIGSNRVKNLRAGRDPGSEESGGLVMAGVVRGSAWVQVVRDSIESTASAQSKTPSPGVQPGGGRLRHAAVFCSDAIVRPHVLLVFMTRFPECTAMLKGIANYERSHQPWAAFLDDEARAEVDSRWLHTNKWDGVISRHTTQDLAQTCEKLNLPLVDLNDTPPFPGVPKIRPDNTVMGHFGAEHFMERGYRHYGFCGFTNTGWSCERRDGFVEALRLTGHECHLFDVEYPGDLTPFWDCLLYTSPSPRDGLLSRMPSSA